MNAIPTFRRTLLAAGSLLAALVFAALWLLGSSITPTQAGSHLLLYVAPTGNDAGNDCSDSANPCATLQHAIDQSQPGSEILLASGTYTGVQARNGITQVAYISQSVTVRGGYTTTNWNEAYPLTQPTTLDAQGMGRVLVIPSQITATIVGLRITGGDASGLGGGLSGTDAGGGVYAYTATLTISNSLITLNTGSTITRAFGGGIYVQSSESTLVNNTILSNTASTADNGFGGGLTIVQGTSTLLNNTVRGNIGSTAEKGRGGGMYLFAANATVTANTVQNNIASLTSAGFGGGIFLFRNATLQNNIIISNTATTTISDTINGNGGGVYVLIGDPFIMINNLIAGNHAQTQGGGLWATGSSGQLLHNTIADNTGAGQGVYVGMSTTLGLTNTIIAGNSVGIFVTSTSTATLEATLWYANITNTAGTGAIFTGTINVYSNPNFIDPAVWNYHLGVGSAAIDAGVDAGVTIDIDGEPRPRGNGFDIGIDEFFLNQPPTADAGAPQTVHTGDLVTLDASASSDPDGDPLTYQWTQTGGDPVTINNPNTVSPTFTAPPTIGVLTFTLTVEDPFGLSSTDTVTITVEPLSVYLPIVVRQE